MAGGAIRKISRRSVKSTVLGPDAGLWWFDDIPHRLISVQALARAPLIGDHRFAVLDRMPEHTAMVMTIAIQPQDSVRNHLARVERASFGDYAESVLAAEDAQLAQMERPKAQAVPGYHGILCARRGLGKLKGKSGRPRRPRASSAFAAAVQRHQAHPGKGRSGAAGFVHPHGNLRPADDNRRRRARGREAHPRRPLADPAGHPSRGGTG